MPGDPTHSGSPAAPGGPPEAPASRPAATERLALALLLVATGAYFAVQFEPFLVPNNDFYTFEDAARKLAAGEPPVESKRLPLFPALTGALSWALPGPHPELHAALIWNALFALGELALLYRLAARSLGAGAVAVPVLEAATVQLHTTGLQPLVEPSLAFSVVLAFVLFQARSPWQYAAAAAVALGRYEAAALVPVLMLVNVGFERRPLKHAALGAAALLPLLGWRLATAWSGAASGSYLELMQGMGFAPAPGYLWRALAEAFPLLNAPPAALAVAVPLIFLPVVAGLVVGWRRFPRVTLAASLFFAVSVLAVVAFGIPKARYAHATSWIPILFWVAGSRELAAYFARHVRDTIGGRAGALILLGLVVAGGLLFMGTRPHLAPFSIDAAYALALLVAAGIGFLGVGARAFSGHRTAALCAMSAMALLVTTGSARRETALWNVYHANYGVHLLSDWLDENLPPNAGVVSLNVGAIEYRTGLTPDRLFNFSVGRASTTAELAEFMRVRGAVYVAWTWRPEADSRSAGYYDQRKNVALAARFRDGTPVPGFQHVATLAVPAHLDQGDVQIYRLVSSSP